MAQNSREGKNKRERERTQLGKLPQANHGKLFLGLIFLAVERPAIVGWRFSRSRSLAVYYRSWMSIEGKKSRRHNWGEEEEVLLLFELEARGTTTPT